MRQDPENVRTLCKSCHKEHGANPRHNKWATSPINRFFAKKGNKEDFISKARDHDPNLLQEGKDSLTDMYGNIHIFPIENMLEHDFNPEENKEEVCWCIPEVQSGGKCEECNEEHQPLLIFHSWLM